LTSEDRLFADLDGLGIAYHLVEHEAVFTVAESAHLERAIPGAHTKNLFLKDSAGHFWLVTVPAAMRVDLKQLPDAIGSKRVSFGKADEMMRLLGVTPGSVTPLAAINDVGVGVTVVVDKSLVDASQINIHPLRNDATVGLSPSDLLRLLSHWSHQPVILEVPRLS
jgi:Ala-tRNA(Pro) deacylase